VSARRGDLGAIAHFKHGLQHQRHQRQIGMVFQAYALFPNMSVADNIGFGLKVKNTPRAEAAARVEDDARE
jgi:ABC-type Fe3+/spermidine/putrescine transport system ATPase subunit